jgi:glutaredoxin 3
VTIAERANAQRVRTQTKNDDRLGAAQTERTASCGAITANRPKGHYMTTRTATLYRMVLPDHICPFGVRAKQILQSEGFEVDDQILRSREEVEAFKAEHGVATTPLVFIDGEAIGGSDDLERYLAKG